MNHREKTSPLKTASGLFPPAAVIPPDKKQIGPVEHNALSLLAALQYLAADKQRTVLIVPDTILASRLSCELPQWLSVFEPEPGEVLLLPDNSDVAGTAGNIDANDSPRSRVLYETLEGNPAIVVASISAILDAAPHPDTLKNSEIVLRQGKNCELSKLAEHLVELDYFDEPEVTVPGEFARRGGLIDIFSFSAETPARIEFFGDEIDSIRIFDTGTQRSTARVEEYRVTMRAGSADRKDEISDYIEYLTPEKTHLVVIFPELCTRHLERYGTEKMRLRYEQFLKKFRKVTAEILDAAEAADKPDCFHPSCFPLESLIHDSLPEGTSEDNAAELMRQWNTSLIDRWTKSGVLVTIFGSSEPDVLHIRQSLQESGLKEDTEHLAVEQKSIPSGLYLPELKLAYLTEHELFGSTVKTAARYIRKEEPKTDTEKESGGTEDLSAYSDLDEGDYAVHIQHGICIYHGLKNVKGDGTITEMMKLEFADEHILYVPLWQAHCVARYIGSRKAAPALSKLASAKWSKSKADAENAVRDLAYGMLRLQAVRGTVHTEPCRADDLDQRLFEAAFPFQETADQLKAAEEVKADMERNKPMDRLLCGDVGFGKTEIAMRAAFKAVYSGRQVAVLVPTTVLAQQHYYSFLERFRNTPVAIEQLSRFKTAAEQREILQRLANGSIDIIIGTNRIVQKDVRFRNLGLIIIDEEQRFGVEAKDRLKRLRVTADVLTMTATPIPRTLYMSISGIRDLSTIMSAPVQRLPIRTIVAKKDRDIITQAVLRELNRGGQVYYLYNRVATIEEEADKLRILFPQARIGIGHGRMEERALEDVMNQFIEGKIDILVSTTIIESGLDIPNANTIIIDRADRFGLAELYQLRGRVGRWTRQAYAYMLLPGSGILSGDARQRISAIRKYTHLGAGFKLAVRDLEIRGSGNILGAEQSGQISAVGFHLYCQLLRVCVSQIKGETLETPPATELFLDFLTFATECPDKQIKACFSKEYINNQRVRIDFYRRLASVTSEQTLEEFENELRDRFGKIPQSAKNLIDCAEIRILAQKSGFHSVSCRDDKIYLEMKDGSLFRVRGTVPRLKPADPQNKLQQLLTFLREQTRNVTGQ